MSHTQGHLEKDSLAALHPEPRSHHKYPGSEHTKDEGGVCEAYPGIIESSDIDPLHHDRLKEEQSASAKVTGGPNSVTGLLASAANVASGAAKYAYSAAVGDEAGKKAGKESVMGSSK